MLDDILYSDHQPHEAEMSCYGLDMAFPLKFMC